MEVVHPRSALLSNYEVLKLLKELEAEQLVLARAALVKKEGDDNESKNITAALGEIVSENMRTVQSTSKQDDKNVARLLQQLQSYALTKVEKLQIVNLLPTRQVELYVIIEDVEDRFTSEQMEAMTEMIKTRMNNPDPVTSDIPLDDLQTYQNDADADGDIVIGEDQWQDQDDPEEFVDGPQYVTEAPKSRSGIHGLKSCPTSASSTNSLHARNPAEDTETAQRIYTFSRAFSNSFR